MENSSTSNLIKGWSKFKTKEFWLKVLEYSTPALISIFVFLFAMIVKGIAPFGSKSLSYIDYNEGLVPAYTQLWDVLHGNASFFASFKLGAGAPMYASNIISSFLSPISWLIAIFPRTEVIFGVAFLLIVKFALMSTTAYICFKKFFGKIDKKILALFSLIWTFSGWTVIHFTNIGWLDIMILLPLFIMTGKELIDKGKMLWFVIVLSYMLILSYYISYMVLVGVVVIATVYTFTIAPKETRKRTASTLFFGIMISILISFVTFIPSCFTSLQAHRFSSSTDESSKAWLYDMFTAKLSVLIMHALPVLFFIKLMTTIKKDKKNVLFFLLSFCICGIGLIIEPINKMWHTGSYYSFPFRYSFILILLMIFASLYYINKYYYSKKNETVANDTTDEKIDENNSNETNNVEVNNTELNNVQVNNVEINKDTKGCSFYSSSLGVILWYISLFYCLLTSASFICIGVNMTSFKGLSILAFAIYLVYFLSQLYILLFVLNYKTKKHHKSKYYFVLVFCLLQICVQMISFTGSSFDSGNQTARITNTFNILTSNFEEGYKLKDRDSLYNANFSQLIDYPTLQSWIHINNEEQYQAYHYTGYNTVSTLLYSSGGTYLTDVLLGNKYVLSFRELDTKYYTLIDQFDYYDETEEVSAKVNCYELNFSMKPAWTTNVDLSQFNDKNSDIVVNQNNLYKVLYDQTEDIMDYTTFTYKVLDDRIVLNIDTVNNQNLYLVFSRDLVLNVTYQDDPVNVKPGFNDFGISSSTPCTAEIIFAKNEDYTKENIEELVKNNIKFATFDVETFKTVHESSCNSDDVSLSIDKYKIEINVNNQSNSKYLFIPYINLNDMKATNNNLEITVNNSLLNFMQIEINEGDNTITMSNQPQLIKPCALVSLIAIAIFIIMSILNHFFKFSENKVIIWIGVGGAVIILGVVGFLVYLKPFFNTFIVLFS